MKEFAEHGPFYELVLNSSWLLIQDDYTTVMLVPADQKYIRVSGD